MKEIYDLAEQYHNDGNNCVESVVKACNDGLQLGLPDVAIRMVSGMGGGIGRSGCVCGALNNKRVPVRLAMAAADLNETADGTWNKLKELLFARLAEAKQADDEQVH